MEKYIAIVDNNRDHDWCNEYNISLLPYSKSPKKLIEYIKTQYNLNDEAFNQLLKDNGIDEIDTNSGSLECGDCITWGVAVAEKESKSGNYLGILELTDDYAWRLFPKEDLPQNVLSFFKEKASVTDDELYDVLAEECMLDDDDNVEFPVSGSLGIKDTSFIWEMCRVEH